MSRIGNRVLTIPSGVEAKLLPNNELNIKGPKGTLIKKFHSNIEIVIENNQLITKRKNELKRNKQLHGTTNSLIEGMITGVTKGYEKQLIIKGVGYKANFKNNVLNMSLGYSHPINYQIAEGIIVETPKPTIINVKGIDKQLVGQVAAEIRAFRKPEPYKGKGVMYKDEKIIRKEGKSSGK